MNQHTRPPSILIVDDDQPLCEVLAELLTDTGYMVRCAHDGEDAWISIQAHSPDLVLSDISMPRLDGVSLALRLAETGFGIPIILMTAGPGNGAEVGAAFIRKPFEIGALLACMDRTLRQVHAARIPIPH